MIDTYVLDGSRCFLHKVSPGIRDPADAVQVRDVLVRGGTLHDNSHDPCWT